MTILETVLQERKYDVYKDRTPTEKLADSFDLWIDDELDYWLNEDSLLNNYDKRRVLNDINREMSFMVTRFQERLEYCVNQHREQAKQYGV